MMMASGNLANDKKHVPLEVKAKLRLTHNSMLETHLANGFINLLTSMSENQLPGTQSERQEFEITPEKRIAIKELLSQVNQTRPGKFVLCRSIMSPYGGSCMNTVVEDPDGEVVYLSLYDYVPSLRDPAELERKLPLGTILAIKNPYLKADFHDDDLRFICRKPEDVVVMADEQLKAFKDLVWKGSIHGSRAAKEEIQPAEYYRILGNEYFNRQDYKKAMEVYTEGLELYPTFGLLLSNRSMTALRLDDYETSLRDADTYLAVHPPLLKVQYRRAIALCGLKRYPQAYEYLAGIIPVLDSENMGDPILRACVLLRVRLERQMRGEYDMAYFYSRSDVSTSARCFTDCAEYTGPIAIREIEGKGRGVVATGRIRRGQMVLACKAFVICGDLPASSSQVSTDKLIETVVSTLTGDPGLGKDFYRLYAGPEMRYLDPERGDDCSLVDVQRIKGICKRQGCFSTPTGLPNVFLSLSIMPNIINLSCLGNSQVSVAGEFTFVKANRDIAPGEEITTTTDKLMASYEERKDEAIRNRGVACDCLLCLADRDEPLEVHLKRAEILRDVKSLPVNSELNQEEERRLTAHIQEMYCLRATSASLNCYLVEMQSILAMHYFQSIRHRAAAKISQRTYQLIRDIPGLLLPKICLLIILVESLEVLNEFEAASDWQEKLDDLTFNQGNSINVHWDSSDERFHVFIRKYQNQLYAF